MIPTNLNKKINHLAFELGAKYLGKLYKPCHFYFYFFVIIIVYAKAMAKVKFQCASIFEELISELGNHFPSHELMDAFRAVYHQYWLGLDLKTFFQLHLNVIEDVYCVAKKCDN
jgi:hypothetical protein